MRKHLFHDYWSMAFLLRKREYVAGNTDEIFPKCQYKKVDSNTVKKSTVCKTYFKTTLGITDRCIRTVMKKKRKVAVNLIERIKNNINSIL